jgi:hypothetical protein
MVSSRGLGDVYKRQPVGENRLSTTTPVVHAVLFEVNGSGNAAEFLF